MKRMNIIITLPKKLIDEIVEGRKTIELRKSMPWSFRLESDNVYVIEKGSTFIVARFQILYYEVMRNPSEIWERYSKQICVDSKWFYRYANALRRYYLWHITKPFKYQNGIHRSYLTNMKTNPQSFVYVSRDIY